MQYKTLAQAVAELKARPAMYLQPLDVQSLYSLLMGWDMARGTSWGLILTERLARLKQTGCRAPGPEDITFEEALTCLEGLLDNPEAMKTDLLEKARVSYNLLLQRVDEALDGPQLMDESLDADEALEGPR